MKNIRNIIRIVILTPIIIFAIYLFADDFSFRKVIYYFSEDDLNSIFLSETKNYVAIEFKNMENPIFIPYDMYNLVTIEPEYAFKNIWTTVDKGAKHKKYELHFNHYYDDKVNVFKSYRITFNTEYERDKIATTAKKMRNNKRIFFNQN